MVRREVIKKSSSVELLFLCYLLTCLLTIDVLQKLLMGYRLKYDLLVHLLMDGSRLALQKNE
jgi:hypothetical protein